MKTFQSNAFSLLLVALTMPLQASAFLAAPSTTASVSSALFASTIYSDFEEHQQATKIVSTVEEDLLDLTKYTTPVTNKRRPIITTTQLDEMEMPRHGPTAIEIESAKALKSMEAIAGRGAMLAALVLMGTEVATGMSLPEQLSKLLN